MDWREAAHTSAFVSIHNISATPPPPRLRPSELRSAPEGAIDLRGAVALERRLAPADGMMLRRTWPAYHIASMNFTRQSSSK